MSPGGRTIRVNGIGLNVVIEGVGMPVLLLHGFPDSARLWRHQIPALAEAGFMAIAPDQRGFGASDAPAGKANYTLDQIRSDALGVLDALGIGRAHLVGHDFGAVVGWQLAAHHPDRFARYVALSVGHPVAYAKAPVKQKLMAWYAMLFQMPGVAEAAVRAGHWRVFRTLVRHHPEADQWIADLSRPGRLTAGLNWYRANVFALLRTGCPPVRIPVMGIWSTGDIALIEAQMTGSAQYVIAEWRYERLEGVGHWITLDAADRLNRMLLAWLR